MFMLKYEVSQAYRVNPVNLFSTLTSFGFSGSGNLEYGMVSLVRRCLCGGIYPVCYFPFRGMVVETIGYIHFVRN